MIDKESASCFHHIEERYVLFPTSFKEGEYFEGWLVDVITGKIISKECRIDKSDPSRYYMRVDTKFSKLVSTSHIEHGMLPLLIGDERHFIPIVN